MFKVNIGEEVVGKITRERFAVRAVIEIDGKLLMVKNKFGDYKFPGGGMEEGEEIGAALYREILEETGYTMDKCQYEVGIAVERYKDGEGVFQMISRYFLCTITEDEIRSQNLDDYEEKLKFHPEWIKAEECLRINRSILESENMTALRWVKREVGALENIIKREI